MSNIIRRSDMLIDGGGESELTTPLCFTANTAGSTILLQKNSNIKISNTAYSRDGTTWISFTPEQSDYANKLTFAKAGDKIYFRNNILGNFSTVMWLRFKMTGSIAASGNINSLYSVNDFANLTTLSVNYCYFKLFYNCAALTSAPLLPATTISQHGYREMFENCTALRTAPALPAKVVPNMSYYFMFGDCRNLTTAPSFHANTLTNESCYGMFSSCTSLQVSDTQTASAPYKWVLPNSGTFTNSSYQHINMFGGCAGTRAKDHFQPVAGNSYTYYTQNPPTT